MRDDGGYRDVCRIQGYVSISFFYNLNNYELVSEMSYVFANVLLISWSMFLTCVRWSVGWLVGLS